MEKKRRSPKPAAILELLRREKIVVRGTPVGALLAAFDKDPDFGPGGKNLDIYDHAHAELEALRREGADIRFVVEQGELADAACLRGHDIATAKPRPIVVGARPFRVDEFLDHVQFVNAVERPRDGPQDIVSAKIRQLLGKMYGCALDRAFAEARAHPANAASWVNYCLADARLFARFATEPGFVLPPRVRTSVGALGVELHQVPDPVEYADGLTLPYQRASCNRAIFDAVFPAALRPEEYINTQHVADVIPDCGADTLVFCYGFEPHSQRVRRTVASTLWNRGIAVPEGRIIERPVQGEWVRGAQMWSVSREVFERYELRGASG